MTGAPGFFLGDVALDEYVSLACWPTPASKIDVPPIRREHGGMIANAAVVHAALGAPTAYCWTVNDSPLTSELLTELVSCGIDISPVSYDSALGDSRCLILIAEEEHCVLIPPVGLQHLELSAHGWELLSAARFLYSAIGDLRMSQVAGRPLTERFDELRSAGVRLVLDLDVANLTPEDLPLVEAMDLVFVNETGSARLASAPLSTTPQLLLEAGVSCVVTTMGARGCRVQTHRDDFTVAAPPAPVRDVTGAGDTFGAVFTQLWADTNDLRYAAHLATTAATRAVTGIGARFGAISMADLTAYVQHIHHHSSPPDGESDRTE